MYLCITCVCVIPVCHSGVTCVFLCVCVCVCVSACVLPLCFSVCVTFVFCVLSACVCYLCITCVLVESEQLGLQSLTRPLSQQDGGGALSV